MVIKRIVKSERLKDGAREFQKQFKKHLMTFITAAFAFVAALLWRDAISKSLDTLKNLIPGVGVWADYLTAIVITIIAVVAIVILSKILKEES